MMIEKMKEWVQKGVITIGDIMKVTREVLSVTEIKSQWNNKKCKMK